MFDISSADEAMFLRNVKPFQRKHFLCLRCSVAVKVNSCLCLQLASAGQEGLRFERENLTSDDSSREDVRGMVHVDGSWKRREPGEIKPKDFPSNPDEPVSGIHKNRAGFGKVGLRSCVFMASLCLCGCAAA